VFRLEGNAALPLTEAIEQFQRDETLDDVASSIERDVAANKPAVALDRLHTYCMKKFAHMIRQRDGEDVDVPATLNARAGRF
jgi:hypothetical protein